MNVCKRCKYYFKEDFELVTQCHYDEYGEEGESLPCEKEDEP